MIYPEFIKKGETIGIAAPSAGVGEKIADYEKSIQTLKKLGYNIKETASVRTPDSRSASAETRGRELTSLFTDDEVNMVFAAAGGDFLNEMIPYADFQKMAEHPKWMIGASDPTGVLYPLTVKHDVASFYGLNAGSFDTGTDFDYIQNALQIISGNLIVQKTFPRFMSKAKFMVETPAYDSDCDTRSTKGDFEVSGRCIGGCIDVLKDLIGTRFDGTKDFVNKYAEDGQIFYFDNFSMSAENFYRTLVQFGYAGWFAHTKAVIIGRVLFESSETGMTYQEAIERALPDIPVIYQADVGHTIPTWTMINGAILHLSYKNGKASLEFELK